MTTIQRRTNALPALRFATASWTGPAAAITAGRRRQVSAPTCLSRRRWACQQSKTPGEGDPQAAESLVLGGGSALALKEIFPERRPDGSDRKSFPSGHSAEAFAAAATLENRYGWEAGLPAFALASFDATARVEARKHHWYDVVAGAAIGPGSGFLLTTRRNPNVRLTRWADSGGGVSLAARF